MIDAPSARPVIGLWGCFDTDAFGDQVTLRVVRAALTRRLPAAHVRAFAPMGSTRRTLLASAEIVEPLLPADDVLARALDAALALVVITGERSRWRADALIAEYAIDESSARRLEVLVLGAPSASAPPRVHHSDQHPGALASAVIGPDVLARRLAFARAVGWVPIDGPFVAVQVDRAHQLTEVARSLRSDDAVVVVPAGGDEAACSALAASLPTPFVLPPIASLDDRVAVLHGAARVVVTDAAMRATASADAAAIAALEAEYDALAARLAADASGPLVLPEVAALRAALDARARRLNAERLAFADALRAAHAERDHARAQLAAWDAAHAAPPWRRVVRRLTGRG
ncbi:MAG TPA: hypothetical protein VFZ83_00295 [Acidimicrobiia bacterium]|nr:hypothetical protein [Acidimicrobiia bacterium]